VTDTTSADLNLPRDGPVRGATKNGPKPPTGGRMAKYSADQLRQMAKSGQAMTNAAGDPSFPIADKEDLQNAIKAVGRAGKDHDVVRRHIIRRAKAMGMSDAVPSNWSATGALAQEGERTPDVFQSVLILEGEVPRVQILQEASAGNGNVMRLKVPFYVGESIARAPGIPKKVYFPKTLLPSIVQEGQQQIAEGKQPLTVYARHAHATDGTHLPVGAVVALEQEGRVGYATLEISPTSDGKDVQVLAQNKHLNAVSLRSGQGQFELEDRKVNGEAMYVPSRLALSGIDFAPDSPAQPTYGVEILQEEALVEARSEKPPTRRKQLESLTLETLKSEYSDLVSEIEAPLLAELKKVTKERDALRQEKNATAKDAKLREIAAQFPEPDKALPVLLEMCKDCETDDQVAAKAFPVLLEALKASREAPTKTPREQLLEMFPNSGAGQTIVQEQTTGGDGSVSLSDLPPGVEFAEV